MKAEEHPLSQGTAGETEKSLRKIQDQLLTKVRQLEDQVKYGFSEGTPQQHNKARIGELEETISAKDAKLEAILKGLREADDALSFANEHARAKQIIRDLLKEHKS